MFLTSDINSPLCQECLVLSASPKRGVIDAFDEGEAGHRQGHRFHFLRGLMKKGLEL